MTDLIPIRRELLERIDESAICDGTDATISDSLFTELVAALAAPVQGEVKPAAFIKHGSPIRGHTEFMLYEPWMDDRLSDGWIPLYTTPPQPAEVGELVELLRDTRKAYTDAFHWEDLKPVMDRIDAALAKLEGKA